MKKRRKISMAWFLFFSALGCLLLDQWEVIAFTLAGFTAARWITSRVRIKLLYVTWLIFPVLFPMFMNDVGNRTVGWCEKNNPSVLVDNTVHRIKEISDGKSPEIIRNLIDKSPEAKQELINSAKGKIKTGFPKLISAIKDLAKHLKYLSERLSAKPEPLMANP